MASAAKSPLTVISGPPGTGKSYTIAALILDQIIKGKTVLMSSRSRQAVKVVVEMLRDVGGDYIVGVSGDRESQRELAERIESMTGASSLVRYIPQAKIKELEEKHEHLQQEIAGLTEVIHRQLPLLGEWSHHADGARDTQRVAEETITAQSILPKDEELCRRWLERGQQILSAGQATWLRSWRGRKYIHNLCATVGATPSTNFAAYSQSLDFLHHRRNMDDTYRELSSTSPLDECWAELEKTQREMIGNAKQLLADKRQNSLAIMLQDRHKREMMRGLMQALRSRNTRGKRALLEAVDKRVLLEAFPCWACTTPYVSHILPLEGGLFDLVVMDEASQVDLASAVPVLYRGRKAVIVGDDKQLNPLIFISKQQETASFTRHSIPDAMRETHRYGQRSLYNVAADHVAQQHFHMLDEHFRSRPPIIEFSNRKFYNSRLRIMTNKPADQEERCIILHHVTGARQVGTKVIPAEVEKVVEIVQQIIDRWRGAPANAEVPSIGLLSPVREQAEAINRALAGSIDPDLLARHRLAYGTADSLQGDERTVVVLSLSIDPAFHRGSLTFIERPQRFNVAITRAKKELHVVTSVRPNELPDGLFKEFLEHVQKHETRFAVQSEYEPRFDSRFEEEVYHRLRERGYAVHTQYKACGFLIDLVAVRDGVCIGVECDGPTHFNPGGSYTEDDVWRHTILRRARWDIVHIPYTDWRAHPDACLHLVDVAMAKRAQAEKAPST